MATNGTILRYRQKGVRSNKIEGVSHGSHEYNEPDKIGSHITSGPRLVRFAGIIMNELTDGENIFERVGVWRIDHELAGHTSPRLAGGRCDAGLRCSIAWRLCQILGAQSYKGMEEATCSSTDNIARTSFYT
jgi:hypothetical protein